MLHFSINMVTKFNPFRVHDFVRAQKSPPAQIAPFATLGAFVCRIAFSLHLGVNQGQDNEYRTCLEYTHHTIHIKIISRS